MGIRPPLPPRPFYLAPTPRPPVTRPHPRRRWCLLRIVGRRVDVAIGRLPGRTRPAPAYAGVLLTLEAPVRFKPVPPPAPPAPR